MTAVVGDNSNTHNNSGYAGNNAGVATIPDVVTKDGKTYKVIGVGHYAFAYNQFVTAIALGANITSVDAAAFVGSPKLETITVAEGNTSYSSADGILYDAVGYYLYCYPAGKVSNIYAVPDTVKTIGRYAFYGNRNLTELTVPDSVRTIGEEAFGGCSNLQSITLPFIGASKTTTKTFAYAFGSVPSSLKHVTINGGKLCSSAFYGCSYIESITLPAEDTMIPYRCFEDCYKLSRLIFTDTAEASKELEEGYVILPERITSIGDSAFSDCDALTFVQLPRAMKTIGYNAFYGCSALERVEIPAGVTSIGSQAFDRCTKLQEFSVDEANTAYASDRWDVLFTKDMAKLIAYPANRKWPYYNVPESVTTISSYAFNGCANLVNLFIPNSVTVIGSSGYYGGDGVLNCPGMTICAYTDSVAYTYAGERNLNAWPMDDYELQGIEIYALPEQTIVPVGELSMKGLYVVASYGGRELQLDDYSLSYSADATGMQTVTVSAEGHTVAFNVLVYDERTQSLIDFGALNLKNGTVGYVAGYNEAGQMVHLESVSIMNGNAMLVLDKTVDAHEVKLFVMDGSTFKPAGAAILPKAVQCKRQS